MRGALPWLLLAGAAYADPLATVCKDASQVGRWPSACETVYAAPLPSDLVRTLEGDFSSPWSNPTFRWALWSTLPAGARYEACTTALPCAGWAFPQKAAAVGNGRATLVWTNPTQWSDGQALAAPVTINVYRDGELVRQIAAPATSLTLTAEPYGQRCYALTATVDGIESALSNSACKTVKLPAPTDGRIAAPTGGSIN